MDNLDIVESDLVSGTSSPNDQDIHTAEDITDEGGDESIQKVINDLERLCHLLTLDKQSRKGTNSPLFGARLSHGADLMVQSASGSGLFPVHRVWLAARSPVLCELLSSTRTIQDPGSAISLRLAHPKSALTSPLTRLIFTGCHAMSILILLTYLYTDELLSVWDHRVAVTLEQQLRDLKIKPGLVKLELQALARLLNLPKLAEAAQSPAKRTPVPSMVFDMQRLLDNAQKQGLTHSPLRPDVILQLKDKSTLPFCCPPRSLFIFCWSI